MERKRLYRSSSDKAIAGVCGGIGEYLDIDPLVIRLLFVLASLGAGTGVVAYIIAAFVIPSEETVKGTYYAAAGQYNAGGHTYVNRASQGPAPVYAEPAQQTVYAEAPAVETGTACAEPADPVCADAAAEFAESPADEPYDDVVADTAEEPLDAEPQTGKAAAEAEPAAGPKPAAESEPEAFRPKEAPKPEYRASDVRSTASSVIRDVYPEDPDKRRRSRRTVGLALIAVGAVVLLKVIFPHIDMRIVWGVCSILAGLWLVAGK